MTKYGKVILEVINETEDHLTVEQIFERVRRIYPKIVLASVYNNVNRLAEESAVKRIRLEGYSDRYDRAERHDHLVCRRCGALTDIHLRDLTKRLERESGVKVLSYDLKISYLCPACRAREKGGKDGISV